MVRGLLLSRPLRSCHRCQDLFQFLQGDPVEWIDHTGERAITRDEAASLVWQTRGQCAGAQPGQQFSYRRSCPWVFHCKPPFRFALRLREMREWPRVEGRGGGYYVCVLRVRGADFSRVGEETSPRIAACEACGCLTGGDALVVADPLQDVVPGAGPWDGERCPHPMMSSSVSRPEMVCLVLFEEDASP